MKVRFFRYTPLQSTPLIQISYNRILCIIGYSCKTPNYFLEGVLKDKTYVYLHKDKSYYQRNVD